MKRIHEVEGVEFRNCLVNAKIKKGIRRIIFLIFFMYIAQDSG